MEESRCAERDEKRRDECEGAGMGIAGGGER